MTHLVQIGGTAPGQWTPWKNGKSLKETALLAGHKRMQESGYFTRPYGYDERPASVRLDVYVSDDSMPKHKNGNPICVHKFELLYTRQD